MRIICDHDAENGKGGLTEKYLYYKGFPKDKDAVYVVKVLAAMKYLEILPRQSDKYEIQFNIMPEGRCYFQTQSDEFWAFFRKSLIVPVVVSLITSILTSQFLPQLLTILKEFLSNLR